MTEANDGKGQRLTGNVNERVDRARLQGRQQDDHACIHSVALTSLPRAREGDSTLLAATRELEEDDAEKGKSKKRSPPGSLEVLEEEAKNNYQQEVNFCSICEAISCEINELYGDHNDVRRCKQCKLQMCTNCMWLEACSSCSAQVCGDC